MDLQALRARIRTMASVADPNIVDDDYIDGLINEAHADVVSSRDWPFLFDEQVVTSDGREVTLPQPVRQVEAVLFGSVRLTPESPTDLDLEEDNPANEDPSVYVRRDESTLLLWPAPSEDQPVVVRGLLAPVDMEADDDEPMFAAEFHHIIAYAAAARLLGEVGDESGRRDAFISEVESTFVRMEGRYMRSADKFPTQAGGQARRRRVQMGRGIGRSGGHSTSHGGSGGVPAHTHDSIDHDHDGEYAGLVHNHDGTYSVLGHDHDADYASQSTADLLTASPLNVKDPQFGAVGDGVADDTAALQAAVDAVEAAGGGTVLIPEGVYITTAPVQVRGVPDPGRMVIEGTGTVHNTSTSPGNNSKIVFQLGKLHTNWIDAFTWYGVGSVAIGDDTLTFDTAADAGNFEVGEFLLVADDWTVVHGSGTAGNSLGGLWKVAAVDAGSGTVTVVGNFPDAMTASSVAAASLSEDVGDQGSPPTEPGVCQNVTIRDVTVKSVLTWLDGAATYNCRLEGMNVHSRHGLYGNFFVHTTFRDMTFYVSDRAAELADWCRRTTVDGCRFLYEEQGAATASSFATVSGNSHDIVFSNCSFEWGQLDGVNLFNIIGARRVVLDNLLFSGQPLTSAGTGVNLSGNASDIHISDVHIVGKTRRAMLVNSPVVGRVFVDRLNVPDTDVQGVILDGGVDIKLVSLNIPTGDIKLRTDPPDLDRVSVVGSTFNGTGLSAERTRFDNQESAANHDLSL